MLDQALRFLLDTAFGIVTYAFLLRFLMQWLRAPFRNPLGQAVVALTDWAAKPVRRVVPGFRGLDASTLVLAWLAQFLWLVALALVVGPGVLSGGILAMFVLLAVRRAAEGDALASHHRRVRAGDPVVDRARRTVRRRAERADVSGFSRRSGASFRRSAARSICRR